MTTIVITDLTRFSTDDKVCTAGIDVETRQCIRPMPYLQYKTCKELNILPGAILSGDFSMPSKISPPHVEDRWYKNLKFHGPCTSDQFKMILEDSVINSISEGFGVNVPVGEKRIDLNSNLNVSIITIKVDPSSLSILENKYEQGKIRVSFCDGAGQWFRYLSITDLGFHDYAMNKHGLANLDALNVFIRNQKDVFLRIGLGRSWKGSYWMQVNGIYTFPEYIGEIRSHV